MYLLLLFISLFTHQALCAEIDGDEAAALVSSTGQQSNVICRVRFFYEQTTQEKIDGKIVRSVSSGEDSIEAYKQEGTVLAYCKSDDLQEHFFYALNMAIYTLTGEQTFLDLARNYPKLPDTVRDQIIFTGRGDGITIVKVYNAAPAHLSIQLAARSISKHVTTYYEHKRLAEQAAALQ